MWLGCKESKLIPSIGVARIIGEGDINAANPNPPKTTRIYNNFFESKIILLITFRGLIITL